MNAMLNRRSFLSAITAAAAIPTGRQEQGASSKTPPYQILVGAIRWDGWYGSQNRVKLATEATLSPSQFHFRLPFFAREISASSITFSGDWQAIIDQEIDFAARARLDYWAFDAYLSDSQMSLALQLYLKSRRKKKPKFCMLSGADLLYRQEILTWHADLMANDHYQTVNDGRPLYYVGFVQDRDLELENTRARLAVRITQLKSLVLSRVNATPWIVVLDQDAKRGAKIAATIEADAIGAYQVNQNIHHGTFADLATETEHLWREEAQTRWPVVPTVMTGLDRRPRFLHPPFWEDAKEGNTANQDIYYSTAKTKELADHLERCLEWLKSDSQTSQPVVLIYAWNENDEGGWLIPGRSMDTSRLDAVAEVLLQH